MKNKIKKILKWTGIIGVVATLSGTPIAVWLWRKEIKKRKQLEYELESIKTPVKCDDDFTF